MSRADDSQKRRREILAAALHCFHAHGYEKTTLADIRDRAGASIGSIYHHFGGKEQIFAALYLDAIAKAQSFNLRALRRARTLEQAVHGLVRSYLQWVNTHRELAGFVLTMRRAEFMQDAEEDLERINRKFRKELDGWLAQYDDGRLAGIAPDLLFALLIGPSEEFARRWLRGKTTTALRRAADSLAEAAWLSLSGIGSRGR